MIKLFQKMSNNQARCLLCPRYCELKHEEVGACYARINQWGKIYPKDYGAISSLAVEPIEKKPFKHFMSGTKTLSFGNYGCNLRCKYCENHSISQSEPHLDSKHISPKNIIEIAKEKHCKSICATYNEPTLAIEYLLELSEKCHENDLKFIIKTNAYINQEPWEEVCEVVDAMNMDFKGAYDAFEDTTECRYVGYDKKIRIAIEYGVHVELSIPIMPGFDGNDRYYFFPLELECAEINEYIHCHLLKINPAHLMINERTTSDEEIEIARKQLSDIFPEKYIHV